MYADNSFLMEKRLRDLDPGLHEGFINSVFAMKRALSGFVRFFPSFTDHSSIHSMEVLEFCNTILGPDQLEELNADEIYVLLMSCYLHDSGMCVTEKDYEAFKDQAGAAEYFAEYPDRGPSDFIRDWHQELSGLFIRKYADMLEIPSEAYVHAIVQVSRGHRKTDLYDEKEYPSAFDMGNGRSVCLPYLAALIRLADEVDVIENRNPKLLYDTSALTDEKDIICFGMHEAIYRMDIVDDGFDVYAKTDDEEMYAAVMKMTRKMQDTLDLCRDVVSSRTRFEIRQSQVRLIRT